MIDCIDAGIRDALPDLIHGRVSDLDRATLSAHIESCADCRAELELLERVRASALWPPRIDVSRVVAALPPNPVSADLLAATRARGRPATRLVWKWAAAAALLVTGSLTFASARRQSDLTAPASSSGVSTVPPVAVAVAAASPAVATSGSAAVAQSPSVVSPRAAAPARHVAALSLTGGVQDLTDDQIKALLDQLDSVEGIPSAEPEAVSIGVDDGEGMQ